MSELLSQLWTPELQAAFTVVVILLVILYVLSIVWVVRDAYLRGSYWYVWAIVALIPLLGIIAYCLLRPPLLQIDRDEQELEIALKQRELMKYGECANCGYPVEADFVLCPNCHQRLKNLCGTCNHALDPSWTVCPYCATPVAASCRAARAAAPRSRPNSSTPQHAAPQQRQRPDPLPRKREHPRPVTRAVATRSRLDPEAAFYACFHAASVETVCPGDLPAARGILSPGCALKTRPYRSCRRFVRARHRKGTHHGTSYSPDGSGKELAERRHRRRRGRLHRRGPREGRARRHRRTDQPVDLAAPVARGRRPWPSSPPRAPRALEHPAPFHGPRHGRRARRPLRRRAVRRGTGDRGRLLLRRQDGPRALAPTTSPPSRPAWPRSSRRDEPFERRVVTRAEAEEIFADQPFKLELIAELPEDAVITTYTIGKFTDLCRGPHLPSTGKLGAFKLTKLAGAYWRGDAEREMLTAHLRHGVLQAEGAGRARCATWRRPRSATTASWGASWASTSMDPLAGAGLPLYLPKGARIIRTLQEWLRRDLYDARLRGGHHPAHLQRRRVEDLGPLRLLQGEHVLLRDQRGR